MSERVELPQLADMDAFGERIAKALRAGDVVALSGGLGAGKTTLSRAILRSLGHTGDVPSPTFTIIEQYDGANMRVPIVHADFYRLDSPDEVHELGLDDYREGAAMLAEWPDCAGGFAHEPACLSILLEVADEGRVATVDAGADWVGRSP